MAVASTASFLRRVLVVDTGTHSFRLRTINTQRLAADEREDSLLLWGEALCQHLLRELPACLVIARGPLAFLPGNKATVGYISPLTGLPHYSFVGGRGYAELLNLGLDALVLTRSDTADRSGAEDHSVSHYLVVSGRAPDVHVEWRSAEGLARGQRSAYYQLLGEELDGRTDAGSIFTVGEAACHRYRTANLAVEGLYHAGRGGAGYVFSQYASAMVLTGQPVEVADWMGDRLSEWLALRQHEIGPRLAQYCDRLSRRDGGTITKLYTTGTGDTPTLPARNAQRVGYGLADLGARRVLAAHRVGQTGCQWCSVNCRHWHWVEVDYAPDGRDRYLDDFEPTYALFAMLDLAPADQSLRGRLELIEAVDRRIVVPLEQLGIDVIDAGVGIAGLFEGLERGVVPPRDVPPSLRAGPYFGSVERAADVVAALRERAPAPALRALANGPEALAQAYPAMRDLVFTCGRGTLANPGHANALWTFLMPFSRFFSHYSGQIYKIPGVLGPDMDDAETEGLFERVVAALLRREFYGCLGNALSTCAFTFPIFSLDGEGEQLDETALLEGLLSLYGIAASATDLWWFAQAFWAQSIMLRLDYGWRPPRAADMPARIFELLAPVLNREPDDVRILMDRLIAVWLREAGAVLRRYGYNVPWVPSVLDGVASRANPTPE